MKWLLILVRLPLVVLFIILGFVAIVVLHLVAGNLWFHRSSGKYIIQNWMRAFAAMIGLKVHVNGHPHTGLLAANHISWLDIIAINSVIASRFVSKDEVLGWPIIGLLPKWSGTFFLERGSAKAVSHLNEEIVEALHQQATVAVFPEGTTHDGDKVHRFYSALLQAGLDAGVTVQALAIRYIRQGERDPLAPFIDDEHIVTHLFKILGTTRTDVYLAFSEAFIPKDMTRKVLAEKLHSQISLQFDKPVTETFPQV